jgi:endonuclease/exonuclease/phosphatase family metal-dependent hydrolase
MAFGKQINCTFVGCMSFVYLFNLLTMFRSAKIAAFCLVGVFLVVGLVSYSQEFRVRVLTYNIRLSTPDDGDNYWPKRSQALMAMVMEQHPDVFGLQEALYPQVLDFDGAFLGYKRVGVARDDGKEAGEFSPIFYDTSKFKSLASGTFWLSATPQVVGSRGWDAACNRIVTWVSLSDLKTKKSFMVFNTHFDHMGQEARKQSALLVLHYIDSLAQGAPSVLMGDFNALPDAEPIQLLTAPGQLTDSRSLCAKPEGPNYTFTGFKVTESAGELIDYIFLKGIKKVDTHTVIPAKRGKYYLSDHLPVEATLRF